MDCYSETKQLSEKKINDKILSILLLIYLLTVKNKYYIIFTFNQLFIDTLISLDCFDINCSQF